MRRPSLFGTPFLTAQKLVDVIVFPCGRAAKACFWIACAPDFPDIAFVTARHFIASPLTGKPSLFAPDVKTV
jgi:hypothetical protein